MEYIVSAEEMRRADRSTVDHFCLPAAVLMERAALGVADVLMEQWRGGGAPDAMRAKASHTHRPVRDPRAIKAVFPRILVFAGGGGNGGDGAVVARLLQQRGAEVLLVAVGATDRTGELTLAQLHTAEQYGVEILRVTEAEELAELKQRAAGYYDFVVDALFGIGVTRPLAGVYAAAVEVMEKLREAADGRLTVLSIDMPSGIHTDTGEVCGVAVHADLTVTVNFRKRGLVLYPGALYAGRVIIIDAGITEKSFLKETPEVISLNGSAGAVLPARDPSADKGGFGKLLIVAGSGSIGGAPILAARAALSSGIGMVRVFTEAANRTALLASCPEALVDVWDKDMPADQLEIPLQKALAWADACLIGPGIGTEEHGSRMLRTVLEDDRLPLVIDADGCNLIARDESLREAVKKYRMHAWPVLTPHMKEFSRLTGCEIDVAKQSLLTAPRALADELGCTVLCKDARSVTVRAGQWEQALNLSGNCGMATAGSGDVLAGIVGALAAQGEDSFSAASKGSYLHGLAGDAAAARYGQAGMTAGDIVTGLRRLLR